MPVPSLLIANRGEIAIRIARAAAELRMRSVALFAEDDARSLHVLRADAAVPLKGRGAAAYLDIGQVVAAAVESGCEFVHPGYGFLSENAAFARACSEAGVTFVGPRAAHLELFGDKARARDLAQRLGVPVLPGAFAPVTLDEARAFFRSLEGRHMVIKAIAGGGGRGMRIVEREADLDSLYARCQSEAKAAFGNPDVYVEERFPNARHVEVQVIGDATGAISQLGERECTIQRRHQKLVEIAPSPGLSAETRARLADAAVRMATEAAYESLGTFEFLVESHPVQGTAQRFAFIEANARLQVEHTVTEEVTGIDLVVAQLRIAAGETLASLGLTQPDIPAPRGAAIQLRVNMETIAADGATRPTGGTLTAFDPPAGRGIRVDTMGYAGYTTSPLYDSLLAKVIVSSPSARMEDVAARAYRALCEFRVEGFATNIPFLQGLLRHPEFVEDHIHTHFIDEHAAAIFSEHGAHPRLFAEAPAAAPQRSGLAGAKVDTFDPLAVLAHGKAAAESARTTTVDVAPAAGESVLEAPLQGTIVTIAVADGDLVRKGQQVLVMESMKMEHVITAPVSGHVRHIAVAPGDAVFEGSPLVHIEEAEIEGGDAFVEEAIDLDAIRPDLAEVLERHRLTLDEARPEAVARRRRTKQRTARENVDDLVDAGTWVEYGPLVLAAQAARRSKEELIAKSPADGMITGVGAINGDLFDEPASRCAVMSYDYTVFAGTQGARNHSKTDRLIDVAQNARMPLVLFAEGGGGRPGDTEGGGGTRTFARFAQLSGLVPMVGITSGRCFAGNASLLGCCDVVIATEGSNLGMGGPAMIEGGGLGIFAPEEIGPMSIQVPNGVVDILVKDEAEAVKVAKQYLGYFQGRTRTWEAADQRRMRQIVPENRLRVYDIRQVIETLADTGSVLELRRGFGHGMVTSFIRIEGRPVGIIANNPMHLGGAIDSDAADKGARFMQLCDAFDIPILFLCDTPGIMVGPEIEKTALVRHSSRMFVIGANLSTPFFTVVIRKAYGLGAIAMAGGSYRTPYFSVSWPTGEFGGMGLEGSVKLGYRDELAAIEDPVARRAKYEEMVARAYERGKALNNAAVFGVDDAIDPADTRHWMANLLASIRPPEPRAGKKRAAIDAW
ncbi:MAG: carbamoyl-phosphate synthase large subunit [Dehalococcoidia bacterium]|nr:carbamoyl-phosphate synthase large subunit [Dehalococcoidia bacterium]